MLYDVRRGSLWNLPTGVKTYWVAHGVAVALVDVETNRQIGNRVDRNC